MTATRSTVCVLSLVPRCLFCTDGNCLICRSDWGELANRLTGFQARTASEPVVCAGIGCTVVIRPQRPQHRFCSRSCHGLVHRTEAKQAAQAVEREAP